MIELVCADSMKLLPAITGHLKPSFDMIFLDPPLYNELDHFKLSHYTNKLLKDEGVTWLCGISTQLINHWHHWEKKFKLLFEIIWFKHTKVTRKLPKRPYIEHENIWCLIKKDIKFTKMMHKFLQIKDINIKSVVEYDAVKSTSKEYEGHPAQKRLSLVKLLIRIATNENDWILDPFAGSGTTLVASNELKRNCLGIEINKDYIDIIRRRTKRIKQMKKLMMFLK